MTDIVERLRAAPLDMNPHLKAEAADEIERLRGIADVMRKDCIYAEDGWAKTKIALDNLQEQLADMQYEAGIYHSLYENMKNLCVQLEAKLSASSGIRESK